MPDSGGEKKVPVKEEEKSEVAGFLLSLKNGTSRSPSPEAEATADANESTKPPADSSEQREADNGREVNEPQYKGLENMKFDGKQATEEGEQAIQDNRTTEGETVKRIVDGSRVEEVKYQPDDDKVDEHQEYGVKEEKAPTIIQRPAPIPATLPAENQTLPDLLTLKMPLPAAPEVLDPNVVPDPIPLAQLPPIDPVMATQEAVAAAAAAAAAVSGEIMGRPLVETLPVPTPQVASAVLVPEPFNFDHLIAGSDIVFMKDRDLVPDALFLAIAQMKRCQLAETDRVGCYKARDIGFLGLCCKHCDGQPGFGRYFPNSVRSLAQTTTSQTMLKHIAQKCRFCDPAVRSAVLQLQQIQAAREGLASGRPRYGSRKIFFQRIWARLHGTSVTGVKDNTADDAVAAAATAAAVAASSTTDDEMAAIHEEVAAAVAAEAEKITLAACATDADVISSDNKRSGHEAELGGCPENDSKKLKVGDPLDAVEV